jgi:nucleoside-diphosphate-sugar epimerase
MTSATFLTGATGYVGSHLLARLLETRPNQAVICLARGRAGVSAEERVHDALRTACRDRGEARAPHGWHERVVVCEGDLTGGVAADDIAALLRRGLRPRGFWHCAASIKFTESADGTVRKTNVAGLCVALDLAEAVGADVFNHVSTAYVAGTLRGAAPATLDVTPDGFNNVYEESKLEGERLVAAHCGDRGIGYRIFRPSIIVGHSRTHRTSSGAGLFHVMELSRKFKDLIEARQPGYLRSHGLRLPIDPAATLNLIPIDVVVDEMTALAECGAATLGQVFHITSDEPLNVLAVLRVALAGVGIGRLDALEPGAPLGAVDKLFGQALRHYLPYLRCRKVFDRANVARYRSDAYRRSYQLDLAGLTGQVRQWLDDAPAAPRTASRAPESFGKPRLRRPGSGRIACLHTSATGALAAA